MSTRLDQGYPELAALLSHFDRSARSTVVQRIARQALTQTGVDAPDGQVANLDSWAAALDDVGWGTDETGEPIQSERDFYRARAAFAFRDAALAGESDDAAADSVYEVVMVLGEGTITKMLADWSS